jgi:integrase
LEVSTPSHERGERHAGAASVVERPDADAYRDGDYVFARSDGSPVQPNTVSRVFLRLQRDLGLPRIALHGLRHSFASAGLLAGLATKVVQEVLGHSVGSTTQDIYRHVIRGQKEEAVNVVADLIARRAH